MSFNINKRLTKLVYGAVILLLFSVSGYAKKSSFEQAVFLFEQYRDEQVKPLLIAETEAGNTEAMCLLGKLLSPSIFVSSEEGMAYYQRAAELGGYCGMFKLASGYNLSSLLNQTPAGYRDYWYKKIETKALKEAKAGDGEAMRLLYMVYSHQKKRGKALGWLKKAAEAGNARAQYYLFNDYREGKDWFLTDQRRAQATQKWLDKAVESHHPRAIIVKYDAEMEKKNFALALEILKKGEVIGYKKALLNLAFFYSNIYTQTPYPDQLGLSYGYCQILFKTHLYGSAKFFCTGLQPRLTEQDIADGEAFANEWLKTNDVRTYDTFIYFDHVQPSGGKKPEREGEPIYY